MLTADLRQRVFASNQAQRSLKPARQFRQQILPLSASRSTFRQICFDDEEDEIAYFTMR